MTIPLRHRRHAGWLLLALSLAAGAEMPPPTTESVGAHLTAVATLIEDSSAARRIEASGNAAATQQRDAARALLAQARTAFETGDLAGASVRAGEASRAMFEAVRQVPPTPGTDAAAATVAARLETVRSLHSALVRIAAEKPAATGAADVARRIEQLVAEATAALARGDVALARRQADAAYIAARATIGELRGGDELVRRLEFASPDEEYAYELDRNDTHLMLIKVLTGQDPFGDTTDPKMREAVGEAVELRRSADAQARAGDFRAAIGLLERSTRALVRVIRNAGVYVPG